MIFLCYEMPILQVVTFDVINDKMSKSKLIRI